MDSSDNDFDINPNNLVCPTVPHVSNVHCSPKYSVDQCWVPDRPDTDCGDGLCCFDGCRNVCFAGVPQKVEYQNENNDVQHNSYNGERKGYVCIIF